MYLALLVPAILCIILLYVINHFKKSKSGEQPAPDGGYLSTFFTHFIISFKAFEIVHFLAICYFVPFYSHEFYCCCLVQILNNIKSVTFFSFPNLLYEIEMIPEPKLLAVLHYAVYSFMLLIFNPLNPDKVTIIKYNFSCQPSSVICD